MTIGKEPKRPLRFELHRGESGQYFVQINSPNGKELFRTSEVYKSKSGARKAFNILTTFFFYTPADNVVLVDRTKVKK